ncbi:unnamed protein product [Vicia faba]|uniref:Uncharacterized protein n=1 Tax=Vicia faba TaxID=3906 RepID=A0AAV0YF85_VICFA|nr:unnamed protein product [Vicia faba]
MPLLISLNAAKPSNCSVNPSHSMAKGLCKVTETGYVVMCDRALPGERFIGRITRKKGNYAEATKLQTLTPPFHTVDAPCVYVPHCGGCKTQNLAYQAQVKAKEEQVRDLIIHVGRFSQKELELHGIMKPIVPCDIQFHYRNKMEFSFGPYKWLPKELLHGGNVDGGSENYALGLHVPGFFDKIINVDKCLLQTDPANKVLTAIQECCRDPQLGFSPYNVHSHMSSAVGKTPAPGQAIYSASKFALNGYFHSLRSELCQKGIQVTVVCPCPIQIVNNAGSQIPSEILNFLQYRNMTTLLTREYLIVRSSGWLDYAPLRIAQFYGSQNPNSPVCVSCQNVLH